MAQQILLAALDDQANGAVRAIRYRRRGRVETIPYSGGILCIANVELPPTPLLLALRSRVHYVKYDPSDKQLAALMMEIAAQGWPAENPRLTQVECCEVARFLIRQSRRLNRRLDLRLLVKKALPDFLQHRDGDTVMHWKDLVTSTLEERIPVVRHTRQERRQDELRLARDLLARFSSRHERFRAWNEETGKSERELYRRIEELRSSDR